MKAWMALIAGAVTLFAAPVLTLACSGYVPPTTIVLPTTFSGSAEGTTRLHSDLLTEESPMAWWKKHKEEVLSDLKVTETAEVKEVLEIPDEVFMNIELDMDNFAVKNSGELKECLEFMLVGLAEMDPNVYAQTMNVNCSATSVQLARCFMSTTIKSFGDGMKMDGNPARQLKELEQRLVSKRGSDTTKICKEMYMDIGGAAFAELARERLLMEAVRKEVPERVIADAVLNIIYLNRQTAFNLPRFNFEYFYHRFNKDYDKARIDCMKILVEIGPSVIPYVERAICELEGYEYVPEAVRRENERNGVKTRRKKLAIEGPAGGSLSQMIPLGVDFKWTFGGEYDTLFARNRDAKENLQRVLKELRK